MKLLPSKSKWEWQEIEELPSNLISTLEVILKDNEGDIRGKMQFWVDYECNSYRETYVLESGEYKLKSTEIERKVTL